jgi:hypothetical protein
MKKSFSFGQSSFEFIAIVGILFLVVLGIFAFVQSRTYAVIQERNSGLLEGVGNIMRSELDMATSVQGEYYREFTLPESLEGFNYSIKLLGKKDVTIQMENSEYVVFLNSNVSGFVNKGLNIIRKSGSNISIN